MNFLRNNTVFWSKLGFCYNPVRFDEKGQPRLFFEDFEPIMKYHKNFYQAGIKLHTCILFNGWVGIDKYDYTLTDRVLDSLFSCGGKDLLFIPRIKLDPPPEWIQQNPEDLCVYYDGPRNKEEIRNLVDTPKHDWIGYQSPDGYYTAGGWKDDRPNIGGIISNQSFSSKKWLNDAGKALKKLIAHLENGPYAKQIAAYHIAYGVSGESCLWGRSGGWGNRIGDYGINNRKFFWDWSINKYGGLDNLRQAWNMPGLIESNFELPSPENRQNSKDDFTSLFRGNAQDRVCIDLDIFTSETNVKAIEHFGKIVKTHTSDKPVGAFYGYYLEVVNSAYTGYLGVEQILNSSYIDFFCAPKTAHEVGMPAGESAPAQSINRKKIWLDEMDFRTHNNNNDQYSGAQDINETRTVFWQEMAKNLAHDSGFWWMDLGGGWYDAPEIMQEIKKIEKYSKIIRRNPVQSQSEVLVITDDFSGNLCQMHMQLHNMLLRSNLVEIKRCGVPIDNYQLTDLSTLDLTQYKIIIFLNCFRIDDTIRNKLPEDKIMLHFYASGVWNNNQFSLKNIESLCNIKLKEHELSAIYGEGYLQNTPVMQVKKYDINESIAGEKKYPALAVLAMRDQQILARYKDGDAAMVQEGNNIYCAVPLLNKEQFRKIFEMAEVHCYAPIDCSVYVDQRFITVVTNLTINSELKFKKLSNYKELTQNKEWHRVKTVPLNMNKKEIRFFLNKKEFGNV